MELHFSYEERVQAIDKRLASSESVRARRRRVLEEGWSEEQVEEEVFLQRMEAGLFTLQLIDCIVVDICVNGSSSVRWWEGGRRRIVRHFPFFLQARRRVLQILNLRNASSRGLAKTVQGDHLRLPFFHASFLFNRPSLSLVDYAQNMGDPKDESTEIKEKKRLLNLVTSFSDLIVKS